MTIELFELSDQENIKVEFHNFVHPLKGIYYAEPGLPPIIGLDKSLIGNTAYLRCVFAEELGHHFTTVGQCLPREFYNYSNRLHISKMEYKALRWAAQFLMPTDKIKTAFLNDYRNEWELAEYFMVTEEMASFRLQLPDISSCIKL